MHSPRAQEAESIRSFHNRGGDHRSPQPPAPQLSLVGDDGGRISRLSAITVKGIRRVVPVLTARRRNSLTPTLRSGRAEIIFNMFAHSRVCGVSTVSPVSGVVHVREVIESSDEPFGCCALVWNVLLFGRR